MIGLHLKDLVLDIGRRASWLTLAAGVGGYLVLDGIKSELHFVVLKVALSMVGVATAVVLAAMLVGTRVGDILTKIGQNTLPIFLMFDMWIAMWTFVLMQGPRFPGSPLVVTSLVVVSALMLHRILLRLHCGWLFELPTLPARKTVFGIPR